MRDRPHALFGYKIDFIVTHSLPALIVMCLDKTQSLFRTCIRDHGILLMVSLLWFVTAFSKMGHDQF